MCTRTTSLLAVQHKQFTTKDLLELGAQRQDREDKRKFLYLRRHYGILRHRIWTDNGAWRLQQPFRMQSSAMASTMMRKKKSYYQASLDPARSQNLCHQRQAWATLQLALRLLLLMTLQLYHLPPPLPPPVSNSSVHTMPAPAFQQCCAVLLY